MYLCSLTAGEQYWPVIVHYADHRQGRTGQGPLR